MHTLVMRGASAEIRWGYHHAAELKDWTVTAEPTGGVLTAAVVSQDAFAASQQPLTFLVPRPQGQRWRWPIESLQFVGSSVTARLGPAEE